MKHFLWILSMLTLTIKANSIQPLTQTQLHATLSIITNFILDDNTITHNGTTYKKVTSPYTGRVWLDRNLGASRACTALDDAQCYGDYYQWGRLKDGHESPNSSTTSTQATNVSSAGSNFITDDGTNSFDWAEATDPNGAQRATNWLKSDGSSVCPVGFRVPTVTELKAETYDRGVIDNDTAFSNFLKIPAAGYRDSFGNMVNQDTASIIWSNTPEGANTQIFFALANTASVTNYVRTLGATVRCIQRLSAKEYYHGGALYATVTSPQTGKIWLDRNLGAKRVCTALDDTECYGDYYQWGRFKDGHEQNTSATTTTLATDINNAGNAFIISGSDWVNLIDTDGTQRAANWSKTDGLSICPVGFRVPTLAELQAELFTGNALISNNTDAFKRFLKLPSSGARDFAGNLYGMGAYGYLYTISYSTTSSDYIYFNPTLAGSNPSNRVYAFPVRCVKP